MFDPTSRYYSIETAQLEQTDNEGQPRLVAYKRRRFIPPVSEGVTLVEHRVVQGDRLDNVTARYLGDPLQFWRICDANDKLHPDELTADPGAIIRIAMPRIG